MRAPVVHGLARPCRRRGGDRWRLLLLVRRLLLGWRLLRHHRVGHLRLRRVPRGVTGRGRVPRLRLRRARRWLLLGLRCVPRLRVPLGRLLLLGRLWIALRTLRRLVIAPLRALLRLRVALLRWRLLVGGEARRGLLRVARGQGLLRHREGHLRREPRRESLEGLRRERLLLRRDAGHLRHGRAGLLGHLAAGVHEGVRIVLAEVAEPLGAVDLHPADGLHLLDAHGGRIVVGSVHADDALAPGARQAEVVTDPQALPGSAAHPEVVGELLAAGRLAARFHRDLSSCASA